MKIKTEKMKRFLIFLSTLLLCVDFGAQAQNNSRPQGDSLAVFRAVRVEGPVKVDFLQLAEGESPYVTYDTRTNPDSRLKVQVDKSGRLNIRELGLRNSTDTMQLKVGYRTLESLAVDGARVTFENAMKLQMTELSVSGGAVAALNLEVIDAMVTVTGKCKLSISGSCRYLDLEASTASVEAAALECRSAHLKVSHRARVVLHAQERLVASVMRAEVLYSQKPEILRVFGSFGAKVGPLHPEEQK